MRKIYSVFKQCIQTLVVMFVVLAFGLLLIIIIFDLLLNYGLITVCLNIKQSQQCLELWNNQCISHSDCCTNYCWKGGNWATGVCKEGQGQPTSPPQQNTISPDRVTTIDNSINNNNDNTNSIT